MKYLLIALFFISSSVFANYGDALTPPDAEGNGYSFNIGSNQFFIGLFYYDKQSQYPDVVYPALLYKNGANWDVVDQFDILWDDLQIDFTPDQMASLIIKDFNKTLELYTDGGQMSWNQELAAIIKLRISIVNNQLVINKLG